MMKFKALLHVALIGYLVIIISSVWGCTSIASQSAGKSPAVRVDGTGTGPSTNGTPSTPRNSSTASAFAVPPRDGLLFVATPLTDFKPGELYLGKFPGMLYEGANEPPPEHDAEGRAAAEKIVPIDGKIVVVGIGMSNWSQELCSGRWPRCAADSFIGRLSTDSRVNHASLVVVDCALGGQAATAWLDDRFSNYTRCRQRMAEMGLTEKQVQVVFWLNANPYPFSSLTSSTECAPSSVAEACVYVRQLGNIARYVSTRYANTKQLFVHSRIYGGYATEALNPEPYAYEYGFSTKWLVEAQINQRLTGKVDALAGDLSRGVAPWIAWGPYFWASGDSPRNDGVRWNMNDYSPVDRTHPSPAGVRKVASLMIEWYLTSPYTFWFRTAGHR